MKQSKLIGISEIERFTDKTAGALLNWHRDYGFPMERTQDGIWTANPVEITAWFSKLGCNPGNIHQGHLRDYAGKQARENGTAKRYNRTLTGIAEIKNFMRVSQDSQVLELTRMFPDTCPIRRVDGVWTCDADDLLIFFETVTRPAGMPL